MNRSEKPNILLEKDHVRMIDSLDDTQVAALFRAIRAHEDELPEPALDPATNMLFGIMVLKLDEYFRKYERRSEVNAKNGAKGGTEKARRRAKQLIEETEGEPAEEARKDIPEKAKQEPEQKPSSPVTEQPEQEKESDDAAPTWKTAKSEKEKRFCRFWDEYPKKVGKLKVWKLWKRENYSEDLTGRMIEAVEKQRNSYEWKKNGGQYIPHPLTWLNRGGWDDEIGEETGYGSGQRNAGRQQFKDRGIDYDAILRDFERSHGEGNDV